MLRNIEIPAKAQRASRRQPGSVPYPVDYCNPHADFDIWQHMFLVNFLGDLTLHQFFHPPAVVLDLGCGTGYWAIEAAKKWPKSMIYGYDLKKIQPTFSGLGQKFQSFIGRIEWVQGNFLDGLPFPSNHFDFVRIAGLGLAIPEDEWQTVLEDVCRVLKPGGVLELIEEDLLFPCSSELLQKPPEPSSPSSPTGGKLPIFNLYTNQVPYRDMPNMLSGTTRKLSRTTSTDSFCDPYRPTNKRVSPIFLSMPNSRQPTSADLSTPPLQQKSISETDHPQDHTRLKAAWDAMLATRFLSPNVLSVIPFYLTSSSFIDTKAHEPLTIALPPNSSVIPTPTFPLTDCQSHSDDRLSYRNTGRGSIKADGLTFRTSVNPVMKPRPPIATTMHLAKTVNTIRGCKEAIWKEYDKLYSEDALYILSRTAPDEDHSLQEPRHISRKSFDVDWNNWDLDMTDRIDMRNNLSTHVAWVPSIPDTKDDRPDWVTWRENLEESSEGNRGHLIVRHNPSDSCRSLRIFTGFKHQEELSL